MSGGYALEPGDSAGGPRQFLREPVRILAGGQETGGGYLFAEQRPALGFSAPLHVHKHEDEAFYLLSGQLEVMCGEEQWRLEPGGFAFLPREVPHSFLVTAPGTALLLVAHPAGFEHFAEALADVEPSEETLPLIAEAGEKHGITLLGPSPLQLP